MRLQATELLAPIAPRLPKAGSDQAANAASRKAGIDPQEVADAERLLRSYQSTISDAAKRFDRDAESVGAPTFNSTKAQGYAYEADGLMAKTSQALNAVMREIDGKYEALTKSCQ